MTRKRLLVGLPLAALLATAGVVRAFNPQPEPPAFGMVGMSRGQTAVLNVVNAQPPDPTQPACRMMLSFVDGTGQTFKDASGQGVTKMVELAPGAADSLRLRASQILGRDASRQTIRAVLNQPPDPGQPPDPALPPSPCMRLVATLEIVSPFGFTQLLYVGQPPDPQVPEGVTR